MTTFITYLIYVYTSCSINEDFVGTIPNYRQPPLSGHKHQPPNESINY